MKLKNILILAFLTLTLIPIAIVSLLLYKSGYDLSKKSYTQNLIESINVQVDYISQTLENNMIGDYRFANRNGVLSPNAHDTVYTKENDLYTAFQSYLEASEDKVTVCILMDKNDIPIYTIGEKATIDIISSQLPQLSQVMNQEIMEFELGKGDYSLGIITPVWNSENIYMGSLVSIYDRSYIFKIISSYYKIVDTSTFVCRKDGGIISSRKFSNEKWNDAINQVLYELTFTKSEGIIDEIVGNIQVSGYYKNVHNSPWYLVGFVDDKLIYSFTNQFLWVYILIIIGVLIADIILAFYFSQKVVEPINNLIMVMDNYQNNLNNDELQYNKKNGYFETKYLRTKFLSLMKKILLFQHNYEGIYQLYQSSDMGDINIDIDVKKQTVDCNKDEFQKLMNNLDMPTEDCIIERFVKCFCDKDQVILTDILETMRDEHLSVTREAEIYTKYLSGKWFHTLVVPMYEDERLSRLFIQLRDISSFKKQEFDSIELASRDSLTGLYNRSGFSRYVENILDSREGSELHGLLFLDMNFFKMVNDNFGHAAGDELLCSVGKTLLTIIGVNGVVSRFGGDEFAVFLPNTSMEHIIKFTNKLNEHLIFPFKTKNTSFIVSASIGFSTWSNNSSDTLQSLMQRADDSMYKAKRTFKESIKG